MLLAQLDYLLSKDQYQSSHFGGQLNHTPNQKHKPSHSIFETNDSLTPIHPSHPIDAQVSFNQEPQLQTPIAQSSQAADEEISKLRAQLREKKQAQKAFQHENLQYKLDIQAKKMMDIEAQLREKDNEIDQLQIRLYQKESAQEEEQSFLQSMAQNNGYSTRAHSVQRVQHPSQILSPLVVVERKSNDMPLQRQSIGNKLKKSDSVESIRTSRPQSNAQLMNSNIDHLTMRCKAQAEIIEELIKEKEQLTKDNNPLKQAIDDLYKGIFSDKSVDDTSQPKSTEQVVLALKQEFQDMRNKLKAIASHTRFSSIIEREMKSTSDCDTSFNNILSSSQISPSMIDESRRMAQLNQKVSQLERQNQQLSMDLKHENMRTQNVQAAFKEIEAIFALESESEDDSGKQILQEIRNLNQRYVNQYTDALKQIDQLQSQIQQQMVNNQQQRANEQQNVSFNAKANVFKRNNAIKKVQGFLQSQQSTTQTSSSPSLMVSPTNASIGGNFSLAPNASAQDILSKSTKNCYNQKQQDFLFDPHSNEKTIQSLRDKISALEKEKVLIELDIKVLKETHSKEIADMQSLKIQLRDERNKNQRLDEELIEANAKIDEVKASLEQAIESERSVTENFNQLVQRYEDQKQAFTKMQEQQLELRKFIDEERQAYNDDREKYELDLQNLGHSAETKVKIIKTKLMGMYDGDLEQAKKLSIEEIIDHISFRLSQLQANSKRISSVQSRIPPSQTMTFDNPHDEYPPVLQDMKIKTNHQLHQRYSCIKTSKQPPLPHHHQQNSQNIANSKEQILQAFLNNNNSKDSILKSSMFSQDQMTKIIELCQVGASQLNPIQNQEDFIQSNISPIKRMLTQDQDLIYTQTTFENIDTKENRIMPAELMKQNEIKRQNQQNQTQNNAKRPTFLQNSIGTNMNHQSANFPQSVKSCSGQPPLSTQLRDPQPTFLYNSQLQNVKRKPAHLPNYSSGIYDMPLQIQSHHSKIRQNPQTTQSQLISPNSQSTAAQSRKPISSSVTRNENFSSILESFRREKNVFNQKFMELKQKLENFSSPPREQRDNHSINSRHQQKVRNMERVPSQERFTQNNVMMTSGGQSYQDSNRIITAGFTPQKQRQIISGYE